MEAQICRRRYRTPDRKQYVSPTTDCFKKQKLVMHYVVYNVGRIHINESVQLSDEIVKHRYIV